MQTAPLAQTLFLSVFTELHGEGTLAQINGRKEPEARGSGYHLSDTCKLSPICADTSQVLWGEMKLSNQEVLTPCETLVLLRDDDPGNM